YEYERVVSVTEDIEVLVAIVRSIMIVVVAMIMIEEENMTMIDMNVVEVK
ncbi:3950_t:CDS:2, partial [Funneliformis caledonium]